MPAPTEVRVCRPWETLLTTVAAGIQPGLMGATLAARTEQYHSIKPKGEISFFQLSLEHVFIFLFESVQYGSFDL